MWALLLSLLLMLFPARVFAKYDPTSVPNNKYGIHIVDVNDMPDAANLVNSSGGDWGYVTLVMQDDDRNFEKWQGVFNRMRRFHLIPIVRLATHVDGDHWIIPGQASIEDWTRFLNSLNWPTENRYVILFNEPNHANEWGGALDPEGYADIAEKFTQALHHTSEDFFVMPAALDVSASSDGASMDAAVFYSRMVSKDPGLYTDADGLASHSYPNPGFSGSPFATGRGTLTSYRWELAELQTLGITKTLPVFITETGWVHAEGVVQNPSLLSSDQVGNDLKIAASSVWQDPRIVAVTPFVLNYQDYPFDHFSWRKLHSGDFYSQYSAYQSIEKVAGEPKQREKFTLKNRLMPQKLVAGSSYALSASLENSGQSILSEQDGYALSFSAKGDFSMVADPLPILEPGQSGLLSIHLQTPHTPGVYPYTIALHHNNQEIPLEKESVRIVPPPGVTVSVQLGWRKLNNATDATVLVYDDKTLLRKVSGVTVKNGQTTVPDLTNIVPGKKYRIVVLLPYYLPRQAIVTLGSNNTAVSMPRMLPLDFNRDGALTPADILALLNLKPNFILSLFIGP